MEFGDLAVNADSDSVREQLGRRIGIEENLHEPPIGSPRHPLEAHIGHAALLCLQRQGEVAARDLLFHRQGEKHMDQTLKDTIPYFIGAVPRDQALKRALLAAARRELRRIENEYQQAQRAAQSADSGLVSLWREAYALGMVGSEEPADRAAMVDALRAAVAAAEIPLVRDAVTAGRVAGLVRERDQLRDRLRALAAEREILLQPHDSEDDFTGAVQTQTARLASLNLLGLASERAVAGAQHSEDQAAPCPVCGSVLEKPDPAPAQLRQSLQRLNTELRSIEAARPARRGVLQELDDQASSVRDQLRAVDTAVQSLTSGRNASDQLPDTARWDFTRGRIHPTLASLPAASETELTRLRQLYQTAEQRVERWPPNSIPGIAAAASSCPTSPGTSRSRKPPQ